jgi:ACR3 family arsenite efflux pump ArsB
MSMRLNGVAKPAQLALLVALSLVGTVLTYYEIRGGFTPLLKTLLSIGYLTLLVFVFRAGIGANPNQGEGSYHGVRLNYLDIAKSFGLMATAFLWTAIALRFVNNTPAGVIVVAIPLFLFFLMAVFYLGRFFVSLVRKRLESRDDETRQ